ncbi:MAG: ComEC/Rec2 family competence protein [Christensenellaceae bacterium]
MKRILNKRPIAFFAFFLMIGIAVAYYVQLSAWWLIYPLIGAAVIFVLCACKRYKAMFTFFYITAFFLGAFVFSIQFNTDFGAVNAQQVYTVNARVTDRTKLKSETHTYVLSDVTINNEKFHKKAILYAQEELGYGDLISFQTKIKPPQKSDNPNGFDEQMYLASRGAGFSCYNRDVKVLGNQWGLYGIPLAVREKLSDNIDLMYSKNTAPIAKAMFLGVKDEISEEVREDFAKTGISHILAISGLHIAIMSYAFNFLLKRCKVKRKTRFISNIVILLLYATLTGFAPSVTRAVLMTIFVIVGRWTLSKRDTLVFLSGAAIVTLLVSAAQLFMPGFLMSYGVLFGILCLGPPLVRFFDRIHADKIYLSSTLAISFAATAAVFPLSAYYFKNIALATPLSNLFAIPLATIIVLFTGISSLLSLIAIPLGQIFAFIAEWAINILSFLNALLVATDFGYLVVTGMPIIIGIIVFALIFLCSDYVMLKKRTKAIVSGVLISCMVAAAVISANQPHVKVTILDVGTGDSIHISVGSEDYLIDNGGNIQYSQLSDYADNAHIVFDAVIVTNDRTKNLRELSNKGAIELLYVPQNYIPKEYDENTKIYHTGDQIAIDEDTYLDIVCDDGKNFSVILNYKNKDVILFAQNDAEDLVEVARDVDVLKVADGGGKKSINDELLHNTTPQYAIISVNEINKRGLPDSAMLALLHKYKIKTYTTGKNGAVTVMAADGITISTMK